MCFQKTIIYNNTGRIAKKKLMTNSFAGNGKKRILNKPQNDGVSTPVFFVNGRNDFG